MKTLKWLLSAGLFAVWTSLGSARPVKVFSYQALLEKCDLAVIATPTETAATKEWIDLPGIWTTGADRSRIPLAVVGVETKFRTAVVLKGERGLKDFTLHHYREAIARAGSAIEGPMLVKFDLAKPGSYLLFLVKEADGRYAPMDQIDPGLMSVQPLEKAR